MPGGFEIFNKKAPKPETGPAPESAPSGSVTWFGPPDTDQRFRYGVIKEEKGVLSLQPGPIKFKKGLTCLRWDAAEGGKSTVYLVLKTTPTRVDLRKAKG
jgi:hypothetical protein